MAEEPSGMANQFSSGNPKNSNTVNMDRQKRNWLLQITAFDPFPVLALSSCNCSNPIIGKAMPTLRRKFIVAGIRHLIYQLCFGLIRNVQKGWDEHKLNTSASKVNEMA
jgi:hypothetical protein